MTAFEPRHHDEAEQAVIGGIFEAGRAVDEAGEIIAWVGINLDTGNFRENSYEQIRMCLPHAINAQFKTEIRGAGGRAEPSDWDRIVRLFDEAGYKGYFALEYESDSAPENFPPLAVKLRDLARKYSG